MPGLYLPPSIQRARRAAERYYRGVVGFHQALAATKLPPRGARGAEQNYERVAAVAGAMRRAKLAR